MANAAAEANAKAKAGGATTKEITTPAAKQFSREHVFGALQVLRLRRVHEAPPPWAFRREAHSRTVAALDEIAQQEQTLSELAEDRPDLFCLIVSVRDNTTDAFQQIHRKGPVVIDFKGETAREDRKKLVLRRLFQNRGNVPPAEIEQAVHVYATERVRLLHADKTQADKARLQQEVVECWPFAPELLSLLEDHILMAAAAQDSRDFIRMLAEVFRVRGDQVPVITCAD